MKKLVSLLTVAVFVLLASSLSYAKGIFIQPGARAAGYGQAFTAVADDATAIFGIRRDLHIRKILRL